MWESQRAPSGCCKDSGQQQWGWGQEEARWRRLFLYPDENDSNSDCSLGWQWCLQRIGPNVCKASFDTWHEPALGMSNLYQIFTGNHIRYFFLCLYMHISISPEWKLQLFPDEFYTPTLGSSAFYFNRTLYVRLCQIYTFWAKAEAKMNNCSTKCVANMFLLFPPKEKCMSHSL